MRGVEFRREDGGYLFPPDTTPLVVGHGGDALARLARMPDDGGWENSTTAFDGDTFQASSAYFRSWTCPNERLATMSIRLQSRAVNADLRCVECERQPGEDERFRAFLTIENELGAYCPECAEREFGEDA